MLAFNRAPAAARGNLNTRRTFLKGA